MPVTYNASVSAEIRAEMARQDLSQTELAALLGQSQSWVSRRISGAVALSTTEIEQIARALRVPISQFTSARQARPGALAG
jgi:transcriptional regulator with XRE-family HTH domain